MTSRPDTAVAAQPPGGGPAAGRGKPQADGPGGPGRALPGRAVLGGLRAAGHPHRAGHGRRRGAALHAAGHARDRAAAGRAGDLLPPGDRGLPERRRRVRRGQGAPRRQAEPGRGGVAGRRLHPQRRRRRVGGRRGADLRRSQRCTRTGCCCAWSCSAAITAANLWGVAESARLFIAPDHHLHRLDLRRHHRRPGAHASAAVPAGVGVLDHDDRRHPAPAEGVRVRQLGADRSGGDRERGARVPQAAGAAGAAHRGRAWRHPGPDADRHRGGGGQVQGRAVSRP